MGKIQDYSMRERAIYRSIEARLRKDHGDDAKNFIISPGYLRAEQSLSNNKSKYVFDLKKVGGEAVTEVKLDRNDLFVVSRIGLFVTHKLNVRSGGEVLQSYPNPLVFVAPTVAADLELIYNGFSTLKIGNRVNIENLSNQEFRQVPTAQQTANQQNEFNTTDATYKCPSLIYLHGTMDIQYTCEFPTFAGAQIAADPNTGTNQLVLLPFGFLIKGAASAK